MYAIIRKALTRGLNAFLFIVAPAIGALSPLIAIPAITETLGASAWASVAVGQSVGLFAALIVNWGWSIEGPSLVAGGTVDARADLYVSSVTSRLTIAAACLPAAFLIAALLAPTAGLSSGVLSLAVGASGLLPNWYFIGIGKPLLLAVFDAAPRVLAAIVCAAALPVIRSEWLYPLALSATTVLALQISHLHLGGARVLRAAARSKGVLRGRLLLMSSSIISSGYTNLSIPLVAVAAPSQTAVFAAAIRLQSFASLGLGAVTNAGQRYVSAHGVAAPTLRLRRRRTLLTNALLGLLGGIACWTLFPYLSALLFSNRILIDSYQSLIIGAIVWLTAISLSTTFHVLIPAGRTKAVGTSGLITSLIGIPALFILAITLGSTGALLAILLAEFLSCVIQLGVVVGRNELRRA